MTEREKVIEALAMCEGFPHLCGLRKECPYSDNSEECEENMHKDALALLKEQEDDYKNILSDYEELAREHEKLLNKKIPLITNGEEVVRCKDCKHCQRQEGQEPWLSCLKLKMTTTPYWFCADGERRSDP